jgi:dolichol-phosphate mannosyltransferase
VIQDNDALPSLSIISPVYGCVGCLEQLRERCVAALYGSGETLEFIFVDDASPDGAWARIRDMSERNPDVRGIRFVRNFGQHYAIAAGVESARGKRIVVMDCDLQDAPEEIPRLLAHADEGFDVVFAGREGRQDTLFKRFCSFLFYKALGYLTGTPQDHRTANFGVYSRKVVDTINAMPESDRCFPLMVKWAGFRSSVLSVQHVERGTGRSGYSISKLVRLALNIVLSYSDKPLRLVVKAGLLFSVAAFGIVGVSIYRYYAGDIAVAGFTSIIASVWLLGGIIIVCIGIIGLYLGRLFNAVKNRPYYIADERVGFE